nr:50S ribosomal protein L11 methyltransferase [Neisseria sp.]
RIVLSGILEEQIEEMSEIYGQWFDLDPAQTDNGWACLSGVKR